MPRRGLDRAAVVEAAAALADEVGLDGLTLAGAWLAERGGLPGDPDDGAWAVALVAAAMAAGTDRPEVLWDGADGSGG